MRWVDRLFEWLRPQPEPDPLDTVQPPDPVTELPTTPDYLERTEPVKVRRGRTYDDPVEGM